MRLSNQCSYEAGLQAARYLRRRVPEFPRVGIVLGSGLGEVVAHVHDATVIPYRRIPHFPRPAIKGHAGRLHLGHWDKLPVAVLEGRVHLYEGYTPAEVVFPVRALGLAGVETLILTCAAGGMAQRATTGSLMIFSDHLNLQGSSPLAGSVDKRWGTRFLDLGAAYDLGLRRTARKAAKALRLKCFEGVYAAVPGPNYETPAEIRALKQLGADAVGMSTLPEAIAARQMNLRVLAIAAVTNRAAGLEKGPLGHDEVLEAGLRASRDLARLLDRVLRSLA
jgi:inosine/guanosine/xanthosine phosphorylase family protein